MLIKSTFDINDWKEMHAFLSSEYRADLGLCSKTVFKWQFLHDDEIRVITAYEENELVGILGYIPVKMFLGNCHSIKNGIYISNWQVKKKYRNGLGWVLLRKLMQKYEVIIGIDATKTNEEIVKKLAWTFYDDIPRLQIVLDIEKTRKITSQITEKQMESMIYRNEKMEYIKIYDISNENYNPNWELYENMKFSVVRDLNFIKWRFLKHPVFEYFCKITGDKTRPAVCIYKIEKVESLENIFVGRIMDFFYPNDLKGETDAKQLLALVFKLLKEKNCAYADFLSSNKIINTMLEKNFAFKKESKNKQVLPARFFPIELNKKNYNFEYYSKEKIDIKLEDFYITSSDGDVDRVSRIY